MGLACFETKIKEILPKKLSAREIQSVVKYFSSYALKRNPYFPFVCFLQFLFSSFQCPCYDKLSAFFKRLHSLNNILSQENRIDRAFGKYLYLRLQKHRDEIQTSLSHSNIVLVNNNEFNLMRHRCDTKSFRGESYEDRTRIRELDGDQKSIYENGRMYASPYNHFSTVIDSKSTFLRATWERLGFGPTIILILLVAISTAFRLCPIPHLSPIDVDCRHRLKDGNLINAATTRSAQYMVATVGSSPWSTCLNLSGSWVNLPKDKFASFFPVSLGYSSDWSRSLSGGYPRSSIAAAEFPVSETTTVAFTPLRRSSAAGFVTGLRDRINAMARAVRAGISEQLCALWNLLFARLPWVRSSTVGAG